MVATRSNWRSSYRGTWDSETLLNLQLPLDNWTVQTTCSSAYSHSIEDRYWQFYWFATWSRAESWFSFSSLSTLLLSPQSAPTSEAIGVGLKVLVAAVVTVGGCLGHSSLMQRYCFLGLEAEQSVGLAQWSSYGRPVSHLKFSVCVFSFAPPFQLSVE